MEEKIQKSEALADLMQIIEQASTDYATKINNKPNREDCIDDEQFLLDEEKYRYAFEESKMHFQEGMLFSYKPFTDSPAVDAAYKWLTKKGERVYSDKGVSYTTDSIIKALRIATEQKNNFNLLELKELLSNVSQLIKGWNATESEWSAWDREVLDKVYQMQLKIDNL